MTHDWTYCARPRMHNLLLKTVLSSTLIQDVERHQYSVFHIEHLCIEQTAIQHSAKNISCQASMVHAEHCLFIKTRFCVSILTIIKHTFIKSIMNPNLPFGGLPRGLCALILFSPRCYLSFQTHPRRQPWHCRKPRREVPQNTVCSVVKQTNCPTTTKKHKNTNHGYIYYLNQ